tara:strand:+ start:724 stop:948 length:225 start_codon:yes stop_codon:yes gene_type:complete
MQIRTIEMKNTDEIKQKLYETKKNITNNLTKEEEEEINIFIDRLAEDLQKTFNKIDFVKLTESIKELLKEDVNV